MINRRTFQNIFKRLLNSRNHPFLLNYLIVSAILIITFSTIGILLTLSASSELRRAMTNRFNKEQLMVARISTNLIEREIARLKTEIGILGEKVGSTPDLSVDQNEQMNVFLSRLIECGVTRVFFYNMADNSIAEYSYFTNRKKLVFPDESPIPVDETGIGASGVSTSRAYVRSNGIFWYLASRIKGKPDRLLLCEINLVWFLRPFLKEMRSGESDYSWIIDGGGVFLYHPDASFIGRDAFTIRKDKEPSLSYEEINTIQRDKMLKGEEGCGVYYSGRHRGLSGNIKKFIAYSPIHISGGHNRLWSLAIVSPAYEIDKIVNRSTATQVITAGFVFFIIVIAMFILLFMEIRWSKKLEKKVEVRTEQWTKSEEKYRLLIESADDYIFTVDSKYRLHSLNSYTAKFFGGRAEDLKNRKITDFFQGDVVEKITMAIDLVYKHGKSGREEFFLQWAGKHIWLNISLMPLKNPNTEAAAVLCIARDITEQKQLEQNLVNTEKLASLGTLAAGVAHEINNPMAVILGFTDLLLKNEPPDSQKFSDLEIIKRNGLHCKQVVENLLGFARFEKTSRDYCRLNDAIHEMINICKHSLEMNNINVVLRLEENVPLVKGDPGKLQQVFLNLITNAQQAMPEGGTLTILSWFDQKNKTVAIQFKDTGNGIKAKHLKHIYEPFYTTKPPGKGTGLGLFITYGIIMQYGGSIDCFSKNLDGNDQAKGTVFTIKLHTRQ